MKRIFALLLALGLVLALAACDKVPDEAKPDGGTPATTPAPTTAPDSGSSGNAGGADVILPDEEGYADGFMGDTLRTAFFDFTVNSAYTCSEFEGYVPSEGHTLLVADVTFYNYTTYSQPMFDTDLQAQWSGQEDEDFALSITCPRVDVDGVEDYPNTGVEPLGDMFPTEFSLGIAQSRQGLQVFEVPAGEQDFTLSYREWFDDDSYGDYFFVYFTPEAR